MSKKSKEAISFLVKLALNSLTGGWGGAITTFSDIALDSWGNTDGLASESIISSTSKAVEELAEVKGWTPERTISIINSAAILWTQRKPNSDKVIESNFDVEAISNYVIGDNPNLDKEDVEPVQSVLKLIIETLYSKISPETMLAFMKRQNTLMQAILAQGTKNKDDIGFENRYLDVLTERLNIVQLYGLSEDFERRPYPLKDAYIKLRAEYSIFSDIANSEFLVDEFENLLPKSRRFLLTADAGFGKTTTLKWLALKCAEKGHDAIQVRLNTLVPFFLQLRTLKDFNPHLEDLPSLLSQALSGYKPEKWVAKVLEYGRGLLLIDGLDEISLDHRTIVLNWLDDTLSIFKDITVICSSRPGALSETHINWFKKNEFSSLELQRITVHDGQEIVKRWFKANSHLPDEYGTQLLQLLNNHSGFRKILINPALCVLVCWQYIESSRKFEIQEADLIESSIKLLVEQRDFQRGLHFNINILYSETVRLLSSIAYWLVLNEEENISRQRLFELIEQTFIEDLFGIKDVYTYLVVRVGIVRSHEGGDISFLYPVFKDYLAAQKVVYEGNLPFLAKNAHLDGWRNVFIYAVVQASLKDAEELLKKLVEQIGHQKGYTRYYKILFIEAASSVNVLDEFMYQKRHQYLTDVTPPRNPKEAESIATAGDMAIDFLSELDNYEAKTIAATIRTLFLIGSPMAMAALDHYASDSRPAVISEKTNWAI